MSFSLDETWRDTVTLLRANGSMLVPLGGVFFLLPLILYSLTSPLFEPPQTQNQQVIAKALAEHLSRIAMPLLLLTATFMLGTAAIYHLLLGRDRPTVGQSIAAGARTWPRLVMLAVMLAAVQFALLIATSIVAAAAGLGPGAASLLLAVYVVAGLYVTARFLPVGPGIVAERLGNPVDFLRRGLALSKGSGWRIALFLLALLVVSFVLILAVQLVLGAALVYLGGDTGAQMAAILSAILVSVLMVVLTVAYVAIYRCLAITGGDTTRAGGT